MKKSLLVIVAICLLVLTVPNPALGFVHDVKSDLLYVNEMDLLFLKNNIPDFEPAWFSIEKETPKMNAVVTSSEDIKLYGFDYFKNDQTFASIGVVDVFNETVTNLRGSYLFDFGLFAGIDYYSFNNNNTTFYSVGYRYNFDEDGYLAAGIYNMSSDDYSDTYYYEVDCKYFLDNAKLYGQLFIPDEGEGSNVYVLGGNVQVTEGLVLGARTIFDDDYSTYMAGFTWNVDQWTINGKFGNDYFIFFKADYVAAGVTYQVNDKFSIGLDYTKLEEIDDPTCGLQFSYKFNNIKFSVKILDNNNLFLF